MVGILVVAFCKKEVRAHITNVYSSKVKTGMGGSAGNKGGTVLRFDLDDSPVAICNAHLESGQNKVEERIEQFKTILIQAFTNKDERQIYNF